MKSPMNRPERAELVASQCKRTVVLALESFRSYELCQFLVHAASTHIISHIQILRKTLIIENVRFDKKQITYY